MKISKGQIILASALSISALLFACLGFTGLLKQSSNNKDYKDWMKNIDDSTSLRNINMPGSHDSMALYSIGDLAGQCQSLSLSEQLNLGVRFLDIRLQLNDNKLKVVHGIVDERASFSDVTASIESFLTDNPTEMIIMSVKEETKSKNSTVGFEESLKTYLNKDLYLKDTTLPASLGVARGKVVLLSRYPSSTIGVPAYVGWLDSTSFTLPNDIYVQDTFKIKSATEKQEEIISCFEEEGHALKINFLSAYRTNYIPPSYAPSAALDINPWINEEIAKYNDRGIVLYDFINEANIKSFFKGAL